MTKLCQPMSIEATMASYYAERAAEYESIYPQKKL
jgi:hypothetical protein